METYHPRRAAVVAAPWMWSAVLLAGCAGAAGEPSAPQISAAEVSAAEELAASPQPVLHVLWSVVVEADRSMAPDDPACPLPGYQASGAFDRDVLALVVIRQRAVGIAEGLVVGRGHVGVAEQVLAEDLAGLQFGGGLGGAEGAQAGGREGVDNAGCQWGLRPYDRQADDSGNGRVPLRVIHVLPPFICSRRCYSRIGNRNNSDRFRRMKRISDADFPRFACRGRSRYRI